ncbi:MAG TPA: hypothetical protein VGB85_13695 [Nannocystis sp.]
MPTRPPIRRFTRFPLLGIARAACLCLVLACSPDTSDLAVATDPEPATGSTGSDTPTGPTTAPTGSTDAPEPELTSTTSTTDDSTGSSSTGAPAMCGDGHLDAGEACDKGMENRDDGPCTLDCATAVCGDGKVYAGVESCDLGPDNSDAYGGCGDCQLNSYCGDGVQDPTEQCDAGPDNGGEGSEATVPCTVGCRWDARLVFLSSAFYDGDFGGLDGADLRCRNLAKAAGITSWPTFRAWLSDAHTGPLERFVLIPAKPYGLPTGERIADSLADLVLNGPRDGIRVDELGKPLPPGLVWTNTGVAGEPHSALDHCQHWDSPAPDQFARAGLSHVAKAPQDAWQTWSDQRHWTSLFLWQCDKTARLYCFEN